MSKTTLVIMAAGIGSRYGGIKQADAFGTNGEWLMDFAISDAQKAGFDDVVIITRKDLLQDLEEHTTALWSNKIPIQFALQEKPESAIAERTKPYGTGQAVLATKNIIKNPFAVVNADDYYGKEAYISMHHFLSNLENDQPLFSLVGYPILDTLSNIGTVTRGICTVNEQNEVLDIVERTKIDLKNDVLRNENEDNSFIEIPKDSFASMNFWGFSTFLFDELENQWQDFFSKYGNELKSEFLIPTVVSDLLKEEKIKVQLLPDGKNWCGVTYAEEKESVKDFLKSMNR